MSDDKAKSAKEQTRPWRDNIEAVTMAIIMAVFLKYFIIEAYKIPTGSMQPTLMGAQFGNSGDGIFDRILVDKLSYHFRDPQRWEVAVFKYPLDRSKNFIKRICGMPGEELLIRHGDLHVRTDPTEEFQVLRRPRPVQDEMLKPLPMDGNWKVDRSSQGWKVADRTLDATGAGSALYPRTGPYVKDVYTDGYPGKMAEKLRRGARRGGENRVGDLCLEGEIEAAADCTAFVIEFREGERRYTLSIPGPAAADDARARIVLHDTSTADPLDPIEVVSDEPVRLRAGRGTDFRAQNMDDLVELELDGDTLLSLEVPAATDQRATIQISLEGGGGRVDELQAYRDVFYTCDRAPTDRWPIPDDSYFMLGDNTQDSADSREWGLTGVRLKDGDETERVIYGNRRGNENPRVITGRENGTEVFFRDIHGERYFYYQRNAEVFAGEKAPFVNRKLITGRALLVFWPLVPSLDVYRLKWIH